MARKKSENFVFVELLQNGQPLSSVVKPYWKQDSIKLTANPRGELSAPYYPLSTDIEVARITGSGIEIELDHNWEGFTTFEGRIEEISSDRKTDYIHMMKPGDYGSIAYNDLRILIRVGRKRKVKAETLTRGKVSRAPLSSYWIESSFELKALGAGLVAASWIFASFVFGLANRADTRPKKLSDLKEVYTLPFVNPKHLEYLPEALQGNLNRRRLVGSVYDHYTDIAQVLMGYFPQKKTSLFDTTLNHYRQQYQAYDSAIAAINLEQRQLTVRAARSSNQGLLYIPSVSGKTLEEDLHRITQKTALSHKALQANLTARTAMAKAFTADSKYDFEQYKAKTRFDKGKKFTAWGFTKDQRRMYEEAKQLADKAAWQQQRLPQSEYQIDLDDSATTMAVTIHPKDAIVTSLEPALLDRLNEKLNQVQAASFESRKIKTIREPLIGEIDPSLIGRIIRNNKFELQLCFELALRRNQLVKGTMEWQWRLDSRGRISDVQLLDSNISDQSMIQCVRQKIISWKFPRPRKGSVQVSYPFHFTPAKG